jgi:hypothetical protein
VTKKWEYLISPDFEIRRIITSHYLSDCDTIIDVGAYKKKLPINKNATIHTIDPLSTINRAFHGTFSEWLESSPYLHGKIGIALLGFDFEGNEKEMNDLFQFLKTCHAIVLEYAILHEPSRMQIQEVINQVVDYFDISSTIHLDLPKTQYDGFPTFAERVIYVLKRKKV